ncbi:hydroxyethylthiazole kinase [Deminuibacter soli]|uniref:Hydroxyethylthiazole kinase n=1 Tax=Deminuibacter soli TaxID=2291815 RepID=A0A3E1NMT5_9BACT|nr:hydroxyethylthiazole kinase [Deminuibacter soli]RFM29144.1 hydroxyethylthiazole kinase [Deminuibacter soli]
MLQEQLWQQVQLVRAQSPLVHNITNYVVMNNTANALLAAGASPVMAHAHGEVEDMTAIAGALVINIGTLDDYWVKSMELAAARAKALQRPWVLDPVGAGATSYRNEVLRELLKYSPAVIRGNASEILALASIESATKGVDSQHSSEQALDAAKRLSEAVNCVVVVSGAVDYIVQGDRVTAIANGHPLMAKVTGMGCTATAITGAFCATAPQKPYQSAVAAMALMGIAGELAAAKAAGPGSVQQYFLDALYTLDEQTFNSKLQLTIVHAGIPV